jgi:uncharacterized protein YndB with AHSA1/START domain
MANPSASDAKHLLIERILPAPRAHVFRAFTEPARMMHWFGPRGFTATQVTLDVRVGGAWRGGMRGPDGVELVASGVYREVVENERLVFTYAWEEQGARGYETVCRLELSDAGEHTRLLFTQGPFQTPESARGHEGGWGEALQKLAEEVSK